MKVFLNPLGLHSRAMVRIANALTKYKPENVAVVDTIAGADLVVLYAIGPDTLQTVTDLWVADKKYAIVQCCLKTSGLSIESWIPLWKSAEIVWSYYDLSEHITDNFYYAPLGIDEVFKPEIETLLSQERDIAIVSSGFMSGGPSEAIEEVANAALRLGQKVAHVGPKNISGMNSRTEKSWKAVQPDDKELVKIYSQARFVSGLRYVEGFEMPVIEGLSCGCIPIVFDRPEMRHWYGDFACFIPESQGRELEDYISSFLSSRLSASAEMISKAREMFNWQTIASEFWSRIQ